VGRAKPPSGPRGRPTHGPLRASGRHGHGWDRVVPCSGGAKSPCFGPCLDPRAACSTLSLAHRWNSLCKSPHALGFPNHLVVLASGGPTKLKRDGCQLLINYHELVDHPSILNSTQSKTVQSVGTEVAVLKTYLYLVLVRMT